MSNRTDIQTLLTLCTYTPSQRRTDTQTPPVRICTYTSNLADTPDNSRYIYGLKSTHAQSAWVHVHTTRHADTPDILNIGAVATAMQTPQTLPGLSTTWRVQISRISDTQTSPVRKCTVHIHLTPQTLQGIYTA